MKLIQTIDTINFTGLQGRIRDLIALNDRKRFITSSSDGIMRIWDINTGNILRTMPMLGSHLSITPDDKYLIFSMENGTIKIIDIKTEEVIHDIKAHKSFLLDLKIHSDGIHFISASMDKNVKIFNIKSGICEKTIESGDFAVWSVNITPNGREFLLGKDNGKIEIWDFKKKIKIREFFAHKNTVITKVTPNGTQIVSRGINSAIKIWNFENNELITRLPGRSSSHFVFSRDGKKFAYVNWMYERKRPPNAPQSWFFFEIWDAQKWEIIKYIKIEEREKIDKIIFTKDGNQLITANKKGDLKRWDLKEAIPKYVVESKKTAVYSAYNTLDGKKMISIHMDGIVKIWDINSAECINSFDLGIYMDHTNLHFTMRFTSDGKRLVYGDRRGFIKIWDVKNGNLLNQIKAHDNSISTIEISDNDKVIISSSPGKRDVKTGEFIKRELKLWDLKKGELLKQVEKIKGSRLSSYYITENNENELNSINWEDVVKVINTKSRKLSKDFKYSTMDKFRITDDGSILIIGKKNGFIKIYNVKSGKRINNIKAHNDDIYNIKFLSNKDLLITSDKKGIIKIWNFSTMKYLKSLNLNSFRGNFLITQDNERLVFIKHKTNEKRVSNEICVFDLTTQSLLNKIPCDAFIFSFLISPKGDKIIGLLKGKKIPSYSEKSFHEYLRNDRDLVLKYWDINTGEVLFQAKSPKSIKMNILGLSYDEKKIVYESSSSIIKIWDIDKEEDLITINGDFVRIVNNQKFDRLIVETLHGDFHIWDINKGKRLKTFKGPKHFVSTLDVTSEGNFSIATTSILIIYSYDLKSGEVICKTKLPNHEGFIPSPIGNSIIPLEPNSPVKVWDSKTGSLLKTLKNKTYSSKCALSPDCKNLAISTSKTTLEVWNIENEKKIAELDNTTLISNISASYSYILVGDRQGVLKIWKIK